MSTDNKEKLDWSFYNGQEVYINNHLYIVVKAKELPLNLIAQQIEFRIAAENKITPKIPDTITIMFHPKPNYSKPKKRKSIAQKDK